MNCREDRQFYERVVITTGDGTKREYPIEKDDFVTRRLGKRIRYVFLYFQLFYPNIRKDQVQYLNLELEKLLASPHEFCFTRFTGPDELVKEVRQITNVHNTLAYVIHDRLSGFTGYLKYFILMHFLGERSILRVHVMWTVPSGFSLYRTKLLSNR